MTGIVELENMEFFARHGCFAEEQVIGNTFIVSLRMETDVATAAQSDKLEDTLNYQRAYDVVKREMDIPSKLLEHVAARIINALHAEFTQLKKVRVSVAKLNPPLGGKVGCSKVVIEG